MVLLFFTYCKEEPTEPIKEKSLLSKSFANSQNDSLKISAVVTVDSTKDKSKDKGKSIIVPDAVICGTLDLNVWEFEKFQAASGKIMGIYPSQYRLENSHRLSLIRNYWGFNYIFCYASAWANVTSSQVGYTGSEVMLGIEPENSYYQNIVSEYSSFAYYVDEPGSKLTTNANSLMQIVKNYISINRPGAKLIGGDTSPTYADIFDDTVDDLLCTKYDFDQRWLWENFKTPFPNKFTMTWISSASDQTEYDQLFAKANNLGLNGIWFYQYTDGFGDSNIQDYIMAAWRQGWVNKIERLYFYTYKCIKENPCDCDRNNITDGWELQNTYQTSTARTIPFN